MNQGFDRERLIELVGRLCDQQIDSEEAAELESVLKQHEDARRLYHLTVAVHRDLESCEIQSDAQIPVRSADENKPAAGVSPGQSLIRTALAASVLVALSFFGYQLYRGSDSTGPAVATVTDLIDATWDGGQSAVTLGDKISAGRLQFSDGTICLTFRHGVVMTVEGPADFELFSTDHVALHSGRIVAYVPDGAEGFTVTTNAAEVVDLGTEFAVAANRDGSSEVVVFDGEVELAPKNAAEKTPQRVVAGLAYRIDQSGTSHPEQFRQAAFENARTVIRRRRVIRESFRTDNLFPGEAKNGWTGPWSLVPDGFEIDEDNTGIQTEKPLAPGTRNYLTVAGTSKDKTSLQLKRGFGSFDEFDAAQPYTVEFLFRLESEPSTIQKIRIFGVQAAVDSANGPADWEIAAPGQSDEETLLWQLYRPRETRFRTLPLIRNRTYRFLVEVHPPKQSWRASVSNGRRTISNTLRDGGPLRLRPDEQPAGNLLGWEFTVAPDSELRFSLDAVRIQNNPDAVPESKQ